MAAPAKSMRCFGRKKTAVVATHYKCGRGLTKINGCPIKMVEPVILRFKAYEPILLLGRHRFARVDMRICVNGGGQTSQICHPLEHCQHPVSLPGIACPRSLVDMVLVQGSRRVTVEREYFFLFYKSYQCSSPSKKIK